MDCLKLIRSYVALVGCCIFIVSLSCVGVHSADSGREPHIALSHSEMIFRKGTRSEGRSGFLTYKGSRVPDCFQTIQDGRVMYRFHERSALWGREGYFPDSKTAMSAQPVADAVDQSAIDRGWVEGVARPSNIPQSWVLVMYRNGSAWIDPARFDRFCEEYKIEPLRRREPLQRKTK